MQSTEKQLLHRFRSLSEADRKSLLDFSDFLAGRAALVGAVAETLTRQDIPRPDEETVIRAVKRLRHTYPMLQGEKLLHEVSGLVTRHVIHREPAKSVIDALEELFLRHYDVQIKAAESNHVD